MQIHELQPKTKSKKAKRIGRGYTRGAKSGRGTKGQKSRAGTSGRPEMRDHIKKLPKKRGYRFSSVKDKPAVINIANLSKYFEGGSVISPNVLVDKKIISRSRGKLPRVKILGTGDIETKLTITGCDVSDTARQKIEKAGGMIKE